MRKLDEKAQECRKKFRQSLWRRVHDTDTGVDTGIDTVSGALKQRL
ncbi:MAG: hypothetical protein JXR76_21760 [Deltaproteobacteria bacterium]|nr:hypothetical protein [Deltaproteobacteria bacterium]